MALRALRGRLCHVARTTAWPPSAWTTRRLAEGAPRAAARAARTSSSPTSRSCSRASSGSCQGCRARDAAQPQGSCRSTRGPGGSTCRARTSTHAVLRRGQGAPPATPSTSASTPSVSRPMPRCPYRGHSGAGPADAAAAGAAGRAARGRQPTPRRQALLPPARRCATFLRPARGGQRRAAPPQARPTSASTSAQQASALMRVPRPPHRRAPCRAPGGCPPAARRGGRPSLNPRRQGAARRHGEQAQQAQAGDQPRAGHPTLTPTAPRPGVLGAPPRVPPPGRSPQGRPQEPPPPPQHCRADRSRLHPLWAARRPRRTLGGRRPAARRPAAQRAARERSGERSGGRLRDARALSPQARRGGARCGRHVVHRSLPPASSSGSLALLRCRRRAAHPRARGAAAEARRCVARDHRRVQPCASYRCRCTTGEERLQPTRPPPRRPPPRRPPSPPAPAPPAVMMPPRLAAPSAPGAHARRRRGGRRGGGAAAEREGR